MKILLVDDAVLERKLLVGLLRKNGVQNEILEAMDGEEALEVLAGNYKDVGLILLDWQMPNMDGLEFMKGVLKVPQVSSIPIVMVTASGSEENQRQAREVNPNLAGYIVKPYKPEIVISMISTYLK